MKKQKKYESSLKKAKHSLRSADHLTYTTYQVVRENKILLKILEEIYNSIKLTINSVLQYEYLHKNIEIYKDPKENFKTFKKLSKKYGLKKEQLEKIIEIMEIGKKHRESPFEFGKKNKIVIMSGDKTDSINIDKIKKYLIETKDFVRKTENRFE